MAYTTINKSSLHMNTKLYTGDGATSHALTGVGFQPDLCWIKKRSSPATDHNLNTSVNLGSGTASQYVLTSNSNEELQDNGSTYFQSLDSDGFTIGNSDKVNANSATFASWNWKANGAGSANTDGSINSTVSANTTSGFSIVKYTGTGSNATVGHGLGVAPSMIIFKRLVGNGWNWTVYHKSMGNNYFMSLNLSNAQSNTSSSTYFQDTTPTPSVFYIGDSGHLNGNDIVAYCFADKTGYSKMGSYIGNGNVDGSFIYTGFKPTFILIKKTTGTANDWYMFDSTRSPSNVISKFLLANNDAVEYTASSQDLDILSNGWKIRNSNNGNNTNGETYTYMAFGQSLVGTNNIPNNAR